MDLPKNCYFSHYEIYPTGEVRRVFDIINPTTGVVINTFNKQLLTAEEAAEKGILDLINQLDKLD